MARGWESKSVEEQINARQAESSPSRPIHSPEEIERQAKRESIRLSRSRTLAAMAATRDERYRLLLERTLSHLEAELEKLNL